MSAPRILVLCGGESEEHEVSLSSARSVIEALGTAFETLPLVIDRSGKLLPATDSQRALQTGSAPAGAGQGEITELVRPDGDLGRVDVVFPLLHGPNGEDGTVQGLLKLMDLPFVGSGVLGSAVGMDKLMMKSVFAAAGLPQVAYRGFSRSQWRADPQQVLRKVDLPYPLFVKPANLGSSVGISKVHAPEELEEALTEAFRHDRRVIVEEGLQSARELEAGVLGNDEPEVSPVGEIRYEADYYDYGTKYTEGLSALDIPAEVPDDVADRCRQLALEAFIAVDAAGLARVDFFYLEESGEVLINEINTMPGFTVTSMYPRLWQAAGVDYPDLVRRLVELALEER